MYKKNSRCTQDIAHDWQKEIGNIIIISLVINTKEILSSRRYREILAFNCMFYN